MPSATRCWRMPSPTWKRCASGLSGNRCPSKSNSTSSSLYRKTARYRSGLPRFCRKHFTLPDGQYSPSFLGVGHGTGDPIGVLAEMLAATMNPNLGGLDHAANYVEQQVLDWCKQIMGFPAEASGILVSGGSMANLVGLTVARNVMAAKIGVNLRKVGLQNLPSL